MKSQEELARLKKEFESLSFEELKQISGGSDDWRPSCFNEPTYCPNGKGCPFGYMCSNAQHGL